MQACFSSPSQTGVEAVLDDDILGYHLILIEGEHSPHPLHFLLEGRAGGAWRAPRSLLRNASGGGNWGGSSRLPGYTMCPRQVGIG